MPLLDRHGATPLAMTSVGTRKFVHSLIGIGRTGSAMEARPHQALDPVPDFQAPDVLVHDVVVDAQ